MFEIVWREAFGIRLDVWQLDLLRAILETYPPGHARAGELRYRSVVVSMGRQNGKTEIGAVLGLWGLLRAENAFTIGLASNKEQADLIYARARKAIEANPTLRARFKRTTGTRGLQTHSGSIYRVSAATSAALQGVPIHTALVDELHILPEELWADVLNGTGARPNTLVVGITTAGSDTSHLLKRLYDNGEKAVSGDPSFERFGFFRWEAPEARVPDDDAELLRFLEAANPALSSGRLDPETVLADVRTLGNAEIIRYRLNRFVASTDSFIDLAKWGQCQRAHDAAWPEGSPVFAVDWTPGREYASIAAAVRAEDGTIHTELAAWTVMPTQESILQQCEALARHWPTAFVFNTSRLREVGNEMKRKGYPVSFYSAPDLVRATSTFYARVHRKTVQHAGDPLLSVQLPRTIRKAVGEDYRISSDSHADAVFATVMAVHAAEVTPESAAQVY